jgi:tight adherence protein C
MAQQELFPLGVAATLAVGIVAWVAFVRAGSSSVRAAQRAKDEAGRYARPSSNKGEDDAAKPIHHSLGRLLADWGAKLPLFNPKQQKDIVRQLVAAGYRQSHTLQIFVAIKVLCGGLAVAGALTGLGAQKDDMPFAISMTVTMGAFIIGMMAPEMVLKLMVRRRRKQINRYLSDALDLMVICTNAGYSLNATLRTVATEMKALCKPLGEELELTFHETQLNADTISSLRNLAERTGVESVRSLVTTLVQSHRYGTPITQALKILARSERHARLLRLEEQGAKLSVKITLPMMLLILPAVFILIGAPAFLSLSETITR